MNMSKSRDIQAKMPSPKVIYASNESKSVLARNLEECRDNDKNRKACFYRLNAFWLVTVKVLNSYFNLTFHCTDHRALCKVFLHERIYTENQNGLYRPQFGVVDIECSCKPVVPVIYCGIQSNYGDYRFT